MQLLVMRELQAKLNWIVPIRTMKKEQPGKERPGVTDCHNEKICNGNEMSTHCLEYVMSNCFLHICSIMAYRCR